jgi:hypothetical protein
MNTGAQIAIGIAALVTAIGFAVIGTNFGNAFPKGAWPFYAVAAFCGVVAITCFVRRSQRVLLRIIGLVICGIYLWYASTTFGEKNFGRAVAGFIAIGLPAGYLAITGGYPRWGHWSHAFLGPKRGDNEECAKDEVSSERGLNP